MNEEHRPIIAVFIDGENILPIYAEQIFSYAEEQGKIAYKEIYGASVSLNDWSEQILKYAIHMNMTIRPTRFKNSSDIALTVGVMDLLSSHTVAEMASTLRGMPYYKPQIAAIGNEQIDTIIIASSDSDFSMLSLRLRNAGINVVGMGEEKSNSMWRTSCSSFVELSSRNNVLSGLLPLQLMSIQPASARFIQSKPNPCDKKTIETDQLSISGAQRKDTIVRILPTHLERVKVIRSFITEQLASRNGRIQSSELFSLLINLPDYQFDQQRSQRQPLDYLVRQYGDYFKFSQEPDGKIWIYAVELMNNMNKQEDVLSPLVDQTEIKTNTKKDVENPNCPSEAEIILKEAGIDDEHAKQILMICRSSQELKTLYNCFRTSLGAEKGRTYYHIIKEHRTCFLKTDSK